MDEIETAQIAATRAAAIARYAILDTARESEFDDIVEIAAEICGTPVSLITLIDHDRQWFKAEHGAGISETPLNQSMCRKLIHLGEVAVVPDASKDTRFDDNPLVSGDMHIRFYAGAPLETPDGVPIGMLCVIDTQPRDLTAQQSLMLRALARQVMVQLELRKALRDQTIISGQLEEARNKADEENAAKTEFLANISHEIRNPMNAILGISGILGMSGPLNEKQQQFVKTLKMSADNLLTLVNDLLDISKIEARSLELEEISFNLPQIVDDVAAMMAVRMIEKNLEIAIDTESVKHRNFIGDPNRLRQILLNLCTNAVKFTEHGTIAITVTAANSAYPTHQDIEIIVSDSGIGIADDKLETIFERFTQADSSITRKYGGTGLGLSITRTLVQVMGGTITAQSKAGEGSVFTVKLTLPKCEATVTPFKQASPPAENPRARSVKQ